MSRRGLPVLVVFVVVAACGADDSTTSSSSSSSGSSGDAGSDASTTGAGDGGTATADGGTKLDAAGGDAALGPDQTGQATYYAADGTGACGFKASTDLLVTAMNAAQYAKADCGKCVAVTGPKGVTVVRIVDLCPGCKNGDLDLSKQAFAAIANLSAGRVAITWHFVACP